MTSTPMDVNEDFVDMVRGFVDNGVEFLIVGAYALAAHGFPRTTGDIDLLVRPTPENAARVFRALNDFGAPVAAHGVTQRDFEVEDQVYQLDLDLGGIVRRGFRRFDRRALGAGPSAIHR